MNKTQKIALALILLTGIFFRFYLIAEMPGGLFPDEAANGLDVNNILKGHVQPFYERGNGREGFFLYLLAGSVAAFGRGHWQHHIVSASIGVLSIFAIFLFISKLYDTNTGLVAAFLMAAGTWHITLSRTAFRAILLPLFMALLFYFLVKAVKSEDKKSQLIASIFAGLVLGGGFYTYIAFRFVVIVLALIVATLLVADRKQDFKWTKKYFRNFVAMSITALIVFIPMGVYFLRNPFSFAGRSSQVSVFNPDLNHGHLMQTIADVFVKSFGAFFTNGDLNWRHNVSGQPFLSYAVSPFFGIALIVLTIMACKFVFCSFSGKQKTEHLKHFFVAAAFWLMLMPVIATAEGIPHGLRSIGTLPAVYAIAAIGIIALARFAVKIWHPLWMEKIYIGVGLIFAGTLISSSYIHEFVYAYNSQENFDAYRSDLSITSQYLNKNGDKFHTWLVLDLFSVQTVDYLTTETGNPYQALNPENSYKVLVQKGDHVVFTRSTFYDISKFLRKNRSSVKTIAVEKNRFGEFDIIVMEATEGRRGKSLFANGDNTFFVQNLGDRAYFSWKSPTIEKSTIKIWACRGRGRACANKTLIKENQQNDYLPTRDYALMDLTKVNTFFSAAIYKSDGSIIKDFGIIKVQKYK